MNSDNHWWSDLASKHAKATRLSRLQPQPGAWLCSFIGLVSSIVESWKWLWFVSTGWGSVSCFFNTTSEWSRMRLALHAHLPTTGSFPVHSMWGSRTEVPKTSNSKKSSSSSTGKVGPCTKGENFRHHNACLKPCCICKYFHITFSQYREYISRRTGYGLTL